MHERLNSVKESWENHSSGFYNWFCKNRLRLFKKSVIESARRTTSVSGLFYNNGIESNHFCEKNEQNFQGGDFWEVISTMKNLIDREENDEIKRLYGSGPYYLSKQFEKFVVSSIQWHEMSIEDRKKYVFKFRAYKPSLDNHFEKPKSSGCKPNEQRCQRKSAPDLITDRLQRQELPKEKEKQVNESSGIQFKDPGKPHQIICQLHLRSMVPRLVKKRQGNCGELLVPWDKEDFLLIKSVRKSHYIDKNGKGESKYGPLYVRF